MNFDVGYHLTKQAVFLAKAAYPLLADIKVKQAACWLHWQGAKATLAPLDLEDFGRGLWGRVKLAEIPIQEVAGPAARFLNLAPSSVNAYYGGPTPLAAMLAGGLLGAAGGYGAGALAEHFVPERYLQRGRLRKLLGLTGGALGAAPGALLGQVGMTANEEAGKSPWKAWFEPNVLFGREAEDPVFKQAEEDLEEVLGQKVDPAFAKRADDTGAFFAPGIPVDHFNQVVWQDSNTPQGVRAATAGLVETASALAGGARLVSPYDVFRVAASMGSGLLAAYPAKVLGALAGLTPEAQLGLQRVGLWAGLLKNVVPLAYGLG